MRVYPAGCGKVWVCVCVFFVYTWRGSGRGGEVYFVILHRHLHINSCLLILQVNKYHTPRSQQMLFCVGCHSSFLGFFFFAALHSIIKTQEGIGLFQYWPFNATARWSVCFHCNKTRKQTCKHIRIMQGWWKKQKNKQMCLCILQLNVTF